MQAADHGLDNDAPEALDWAADPRILG